MEEDICLQYLKSKSKIQDEKDLPNVLSLLTQSDSDPNFANCKWIIDSFSEGHFRLEDIQRVKDDLIKFQTLFGVRRPFPNKGYRELKVMNREKEEKEEKKLTAKTTNKSKQLSTISFNDCKGYFKNVKNTLPDEYKNLSSNELEQFYQRIEDSNPTSDFNNCIWIVEEIKKGNIEDQDLPEVKKYLTSYFSKYNLSLPNFYPQFPAMNNYQLVKDAIDGKVDLFSASDLGILLSPKTEKVSCYYGVNTRWCTANEKNNMFDHYNKLGTIYTWFDKVLKDKYQLHFEESQFKDRDDNSVNLTIANKLFHNPVLHSIFDEYFTKQPKYAYLFITDELNLQRWPDVEPYIMKNPRYAYFYARNILQKRWPEAEPYIMKDAKIALSYAKDILKKSSWPEAEKGILMDPGFAYLYAKNQLGLSGKELEKYILNNPEFAYLYAKEVMKDKWPAGEYLIMKSPKYAYLYAKDILKNRWIEAENNILNDPESAYLYAKDLIKDRVPEAESKIMKIPRYAYLYAKEVIKGKWPEAEPYILTDSQQKYLYNGFLYRLGLEPIK
jgi:hypothetical protein